MRKFGRWSNKSSSDQALPHLTHRDPVVVEGPKKVISATRSFQPPPGQSEYLPFKAGDFFHVVAREDDLDWYEVEGLGNRRGLVPRNHFEEVGKEDRRQKKNEHDSGFSEGNGTQLGSRGSVGGPDAAEAARKQSMSSQRSGKAGTLIYGVVSYDFNAERADELAASAGEKVIIIAQSNPEWFVAKPIQRLGGPGLIPVAFVTIYYTADDTQVANPIEAVRAAGVPRVEEWKQRAAHYKNNSVPLGRLGTTQGSSQQSLNGSMQRLSGGTGMSRRSQDTHRDAQRQSQHSNSTGYTAQRGLLIPIDGHVPGYSRDPDSGDYWFRVEVNTEDRRAWGLRRRYQDFYEMQVALFQQFPQAAGKTGDNRILPTLPGPLLNSTLELAKQRLPFMDVYVQQLLRLGRPISDSHQCRNFFSPKEDDEQIDPFEVPAPERDSTNSYQSSQSGAFTQSNNSNSGYGGTSGPYLSSQREQPQRQYQQQPLQSHRPASPYGQNGESHFRSPSNGRPPNGTPNGMPYAVQRNNPNMNTGSSTSFGSAHNQPVPAAQPGAMTKVKVFLGENCILLRLPSMFTYDDLLTKVRERWLLEPGADRSKDVNFSITFKDEQWKDQNYRLANEEDLRTARSRNEKLTITVKAI